MPRRPGAQTYDLDITMTGITSSPVTFAGSFTFNPAAHGWCSAAFCAPGITPSFAAVSISDPLSIDAPGGPYVFIGAAGPHLLVAGPHRTVRQLMSRVGIARPGR